MPKVYMGQIRDGNRVLAVFVTPYDHDSVSFYDDNNNLLAQWDYPDTITAAEEYRDKHPEFLTQIKSMWLDILLNNSKLALRNKELADILEALDMDLGFPLVLEDDDRQREKDIIKAEEEKKKEDEQNPNLVHGVVYSRSEIALNELVDNRYTVGDYLDISDPEAKLICVDSCDLKDGSAHSKFTFLIKYPDGRLEKPTMLSQDDGTDPDRDIYSSNNDGSNVSKVDARSMYRIKSPLGQNCMLAVSYASYGTVNVHFGKRDLTEQDFIATTLENKKLHNITHTNYVSPEVQSLLDPARGTDQAYKATKEAASHIKHGCRVTIAEADGDEQTGHQHPAQQQDFEKVPDEDYYLTIAAQILEENPQLEEQYSVKGLADDLQKYLANHPAKTIKDFTDDRVAGCAHYPSHNI